MFRFQAGRSFWGKIVLTISIFFSTFGADAWAQGKGAPSIILPKLYLLDNLEINAGQIGELKACHQKVRQFGDSLAIDHAEHREVIANLSQKRSLDLNQVSLSRSEVRAVRQMRMTLQELSQMTTCDFDSDFLKAMIDAHRFAIQLVQSSMTRENDQELRRFLQSTLETLKTHEQMARTMWTDLEKNGGANEGENSGGEQCGSQGQQQGQDCGDNSGKG